MGLHGWIRTGARMTISRHAVNLYRATSGDGSSQSRTSVTVDWPVDAWLHAKVWEHFGRFWYWEIRNSQNRIVDTGTSKNDAGARRAVITRLPKLIAGIRQHPAIAELEAGKLKPLLERGYSRAAGEKAEAA